jgi:DNA-binding NtrC family response regulator
MSAHVLRRGVPVVLVSEAADRRAATRDVLASAGFAVHEAGSVAAACGLLRRHPRPHIVVCASDSGVCAALLQALSQSAEKLCQHAFVMLVSGWDILSLSEIPLNIYLRLVRLPCEPPLLRATIERAEQHLLRDRRRRGLRAPRPVRPEPPAWPV